MGNDSPSFLASSFRWRGLGGGDLLLERSPIVHANRVTTPTLILHGEHDPACAHLAGIMILQCPEALWYRDPDGVYPRTGHVPPSQAVLDVMTASWHGWSSF